MENQKAGPKIKIVIVIGFIVSIASAVYLVTASKFKTLSIKTSGDLTLITSSNQILKLIPEACQFQKIHELSVVTLNSHNNFDLIAEYSTGPGGITTITVKNPGDNAVTTFKKTECEIFSDSLNEIDHAGSIELSCKRDTVTLNGKMHFSDCVTKHP